jgi:hypothetical protein
MRTALALASRSAELAGGGSIATLDPGPPERINHHILAIHQPNLAENVM